MHRGCRPRCWSRWNSASCRGSRGDHAGACCACLGMGASSASRASCASSASRASPRSPQSRGAGAVPSRSSLPRSLPLCLDETCRHIGCHRTGCHRTGCRCTGCRCIGCTHRCCSRGCSRQSSRRHCNGWIGRSADCGSCGYSRRLAASGCAGSQRSCSQQSRASAHPWRAPPPRRRLARAARSWAQGAQGAQGARVRSRWRGCAVRWHGGQPRPSPPLSRARVPYAPPSPPRRRQRHPSE